MTLKFEIDADGRSALRLAMLVDSEVVWPHPDLGDGSAEFDPEDVLSYLADSWASLLLAWTWPIAFEPHEEPRSLTGLQRASELRWELLADEVVVEKESRLLDEFLYKHDFAQMKYGAGLESCFLLREHATLRIETFGRIVDDVKFSEFAAELEKLGNNAAALLDRRDDLTASRLLDRWKNREHGDPAAQAALISGVALSDVETNDGIRNLLFPELGDRRISEVANDNRSPLLAAARTSGALGPSGLTKVLSLVNRTEDGEIAQLGTIRRGVRQRIGDARQPLEQGIRAATYVRESVRQPSGSQFDLDAFTAALKISVQQHAMCDSRLDGLTIAGPRHGPAILLNTNTRRRGATAEDLDRALRFTWAHEIGHLLTDYDQWAALIDAVAQRVPRDVEVRANAFAVTLLLPQDIAYATWDEAGAPFVWQALEALLNRLTGTYGLPRIAAARQIAHGAPPERRGRLHQIFAAHIEAYS